MSKSVKGKRTNKGGEWLENVELNARRVDHEVFIIAKGKGVAKQYVITLAQWRELNSEVLYGNDARAFVERTRQ